MTIFQEVWCILLQVLPSTKKALLRLDSMFQSYGAKFAFHLNLSLVEMEFRVRVRKLRFN